MTVELTDDERERFGMVQGLSAYPRVLDAICGVAESIATARIADAWDEGAIYVAEQTSNAWSPEFYTDDNPYRAPTQTSTEARA